MKAFLLLAFVLLKFLGYSQSSGEEFEGRIHYQNKFIVKDPSVDSVDLLKRMGSASIYTYKKGKFLWTSVGSTFQYEIYDPFTGVVIDKYSDNDSVQVIDVFKKADSMTYFKIVKSVDVICGYVCDAIEFKIQSLVDGTVTTRTIFYSPRLYVDPTHFHRYRSYANNQIYFITKAVPLRLVTEYAGLPVTFIINATSVEFASIDDNQFKLK